jgi:hypothetical protein
VSEELHRRVDEGLKRSLMKSLEKSNPATSACLLVGGKFSRFVFANQGWKPDDNVDR